MHRGTYRRRVVYVGKPEWITELHIYATQTRIIQHRGVGSDIVALDPDTLDYLCQLWQEVKANIAAK